MTQAKPKQNPSKRLAERKQEYLKRRRAKKLLNEIQRAFNEYLTTVK